jgi:hypothetical protein
VGLDTAATQLRCPTPMPNGGTGGCGAVDCSTPAVGADAGGGLEEDEAGGGAGETPAEGADAGGGLEEDEAGGGAGETPAEGADAGGGSEAPWLSFSACSLSAFRALFRLLLPRVITAAVGWGRRYGGGCSLGLRRRRRRWRA